MNFLLTPNKGKVEKHAAVHCFYCKKVFKNHQALGGHLRTHREEINSKRSWNYPSHFIAQPFSMSHSEIFSGGAGGNPSTRFSEAISPLGFSMRLYSNESSSVNVSTFRENNMSGMPPKFSSCSGHAATQNYKALPYIAPAPSGSVVPTPLHLPFSLVSNRVCQLNTSQFRSLKDAMPSFSENALPYFQGHNCGMTPYLVNSVTDLHPGLSSNQSSGFKKPNTIGSLPPHPSQSSGQGEIGRYKKQTVLTSERGKRRCRGEAGGSDEMMNTATMPKINSKLSRKTNKPPHARQPSGQGEIGRYKKQTVLTSERGKRRCRGEAGRSGEMMNASKRPKINSKLSRKTNKPPHPSQSSGPGEIGQRKTKPVLTSERGKRRCLGEARGSSEMMNASKKPKINSELSKETDKPPNRELLLFKDVENCCSGSGISSKANEEGETNLDLSLHL